MEIFIHFLFYFKRATESDSFILTLSAQEKYNFHTTLLAAISCRNSYATDSNFPTNTNSYKKNGQTKTFLLLLSCLAAEKSGISPFVHSVRWPRNHLIPNETSNMHVCERSEPDPNRYITFPLTFWSDMFLYIFRSFSSSILFFEKKRKLFSLPPFFSHFIQITFLLATGTGHI